MWPWYVGGGIFGGLLLFGSVMREDIEAIAALFKMAAGATLIVALGFFYGGMAD